MSKKLRRSLNDDIHGDRATRRGYALPKPSVWDDELSAVKSYLPVAYEPKSSDHHGHHVRCYNTHPVLKMPGTELLIYGGSCGSPVVKDADVYIGFDSIMHQTPARWPWNAGEEVYFKIEDMCAPAHPAEFKKLIEWTRQQLEAGKKVHAGCIGGHGRTGTFLAALVSTYGEPDAISYVRQHYCQKAVESSGQIKFLHTHFGVTPVQGSKDGFSSSKAKTSSTKGFKSVTTVQAKTLEVFAPLKDHGCIWG